MSNIKKFIGERAYKCIENSAYDEEALRSALLTPQNARAVFADLTEYEVKSLVAEISNSNTIGQVRPTTQEEIRTTFAKAGYTTIIFDDKQAIEECAKYYRENERICTYHDLEARMREYHMLVAIKGNIDEIKRPHNPQRDDEYGTSILNIQIARNGSHMSIKNRYNHTVPQCDSTLDNNLDNIHDGLQSMVLGYYGFAGLTKQNRKHYPNVVNIGGIYLKYHTERNNIYFGAFVLDGVNGARYVDTSRYYVTNNTLNHWNFVPMVLDFQEKRAIDLIGGNGKVPLVSRALREGILHSGNKEQAEIIKAVFPNAKKELLQANKKALKYIANTYGYDFQKPHKISGMLGNFTATGIEKIIGSNNALLLLSDGSGRLSVVGLKHGEFQTKLRGDYKCNIDTFFTYKLFEAMRKRSNIAVYIIQQDEEYIRGVKDKKDSHAVQLQLKQRLKIYKENKRKNEADSTDCTIIIKEIEDKFTALKDEVITKLINANKYEEYCKIASVNLSWLVLHIEEFKIKAETKSFKSPQEIQYLATLMREKIDIMWNKLK